MNRLGIKGHMSGARGTDILIYELITLEKDQSRRRMKDGNTTEKKDVTGFRQNAIKKVVLFCLKMNPGFESKPCD